MSYFRENIDAMQGYTPGKQSQSQDVIKLNTNENPFPPSPKAQEALRSFDLERLKKYPPPASDPVRIAAAKVWGKTESQVLATNGSDEALTVIFRCFAAEGEKVGWLDPSYSLYPVLANIQGNEHVEVSLNDDFSLPMDWEEQAKGCKIFFITRPNAPTGINLDKARIEEFIQAFDGIAVVDEAYADFAEDNCLDLIEKYENVIVTRTMSKSYSLAGIRAGFAVSNEKIIAGMHKVRDSYNVNFLTQIIVEASLLDQDYLSSCVESIINERNKVAEVLMAWGFEIMPSASNFLFVKPPVSAPSAQKITENLADQEIYVRHFKTKNICEFLRVSIGSSDEMKAFLKAVQEML